jgi:hypothetical protein
MQMGHQQQGAPIQTSMVVTATTMADFVPNMRTSAPASAMAIPNNVGQHKRPSVNMMETKSAGLPVYQPMTMSGHEALGHHQPTVHPSLYHQAILQQLQQQQQQQQQQQASQQTYLPAAYANPAPMTIPRFP